MISIDPKEYLNSHRFTVLFSGGELSRIMLALKVVLLEKDIIPTMIFDEIDRIYRIMYQIGYKDFLFEAGRKDVKIVSIHVGYNQRRGVFKRAHYILPGFKEISELPYRFWDLAGIAALGWAFFNDVDIVLPHELPHEHEVRGAASIILLSKPRRRILPEELSEPRALKR